MTGDAKCETTQEYFWSFWCAWCVGCVSAAPNRLLQPTLGLKVNTIIRPNIPLVPIVFFKSAALFMLIKKSVSPLGRQINHNHDVIRILPLFYFVIWQLVLE